MVTKPKSFPIPVLYLILKGLKVRPAKGRFRAVKGQKTSESDKRMFRALLEAAQKAKSPRQFETLLGQESTDRLAERYITVLTVSYRTDGTMLISVRFSDGTG